METIKPYVSKSDVGFFTEIANENLINHINNEVKVIYSTKINNLLIHRYKNRDTI